MKNTSSLSIFLFCICSVGSVQAQIIKPDTTTSWKRKFVFNFNVNQASFSSNWSAGGINSLGLSSLVNYKFNYKKNRDSWDNEIDLLYGFVNNAGQGFRKTTDRIYIDTKYGYQLNKKWDLFTSLNFSSQFSRGYKYADDAAGVEQKVLISDFLAPAFVTGALGFEYHPVEYFKVRISPFSPRLTIVNDPERFYPAFGPNPYGLDSAKSTRFEWLAAQVVAEFNKDIAQNVNLKFRYLMFANFETIEPKTIDHRLDVNFTAKVNRFITVGLGGILLYDYDQDDGVQLSQAMTIGFAYSFQNFEEPK